MNDSISLQITGGSVIVDSQDAALVRSMSWYVATTHGNRYAVHGAVGRKDLTLHRLILDARPEQYVDHANGDGLDNRRANLRICTVTQNNQNRRGKAGRALYKGVYPVKGGTWHARINANGIRHLLGNHPSPEQAARAYDTAAKELHGEFARLNFPEGGP